MTSLRVDDGGCTAMTRFVIAAAQRKVIEHSEVMPGTSRAVIRQAATAGSPDSACASSRSS